MKNITITTPAIYNNEKVDADFIFELDDNDNVILDSNSEIIRIPKDIFMQAVKEKILKFTLPVKKEEKNEWRYNADDYVDCNSYIGKCSL